MAFCANCGAKLDDNARFCTECGTQTAYQVQGADTAAYSDTQTTFTADNAPPAAPVPPVYNAQQAPGAQQNTYNTPPYQTQQPSNRKHPRGYGLSIASLIFGILGGFLGLIFGIVALVMNREAKDKGVNVRSILGIVFWVFWMIVLAAL